MSHTSVLVPTPGLGLGSMLKLVSAPVGSVLTLDQAKGHLRVDTNDENAGINAFVAEAVSGVEEDTHLALLTQTVDQTIDRFPRGWTPLELLRGPLQSVTSITYYDTNDAAQTFASSSYEADTDYLPGRVLLKSGQEWPSDVRSRKAGVVRFVCGFGDAASAIPALLLAAVKIRLLALHERRDMRDDEVAAYQRCVGPWTLHFVGD